VSAVPCFVAAATPLLLLLPLQACGTGCLMVTSWASQVSNQSLNQSFD
jgi:hypothetical protein